MTARIAGMEERVWSVDEDTGEESGRRLKVECKKKTKKKQEEAGKVEKIRVREGTRKSS